MAERTDQLNFIDFEVIKEPWNEHWLEDGSILRVKVVLVGLIKESETEFFVQTNNVLGLRPNPKFMGSPSPPLKPGEKLEDFIEAEDLKIEKSAEEWNEYALSSEKATLSIKGVPVIVSRTSRHDAKGLPIYNATIQILIKPKKGKK